MTQIRNAEINTIEVGKYDGEGDIRHLAKSFNTQDDANDVAQSFRDAATTRKNAPVIWNLRGSFRRLLLIAGGCAIAIAVLLALTVLRAEDLVGVRLYAVFAAVGIGAAVGVWAALKARAIRREDARHPSIIDAAQVEDAARFTTIFGPLGPFDSAGILLALAAGIDAGLAGWIVGSGLAESVPLIVVLVISVVFALVFISVLTWIAARFGERCASIRARLWVRNLTRIDFGRFPEKTAELAYVRQTVAALCDDNFAKPSIVQYLFAAGLLLLIPVAFTALLLFRLYVANGNGAVDVLAVGGVSAGCAAIAMLAAALGGPLGHLLPELARGKTALNRRFPSVPSFLEWQAAYARQCERWANLIATRLNAMLSQMERDGDHRWLHGGVVVPRPFPSREVPREDPGAPNQGLASTPSDKVVGDGAGAAANDRDQSPNPVPEVAPGAETSEVGRNLQEAA